MMREHRLARRLISIAIAAAMLSPALASAAEAAVSTWLAPLPGHKIAARNVEVSVGYNTQSDKKVTRIELWIDSRRTATKTLVRPETRGVCSFWWDTSQSPRGAHTLIVRIFAGDELISTVSGNGTIGEASFDLRAPTVRFAGIKSGDVLKGVASITMAVSDDSHEPPIVSLLVDNALKFLTNRQPYVYSLDTTKYTDGDHELQTFAYDTSGNKSNPAVVKVAFKNGLERPVVTSLAIDRNPAPVAPSEDDGVGKLLPPVEREMRTVGAARSVEPEVHAKTSVPRSRPVAPRHEPVRSAPVAVKARPSQRHLAPPAVSRPSSPRVSASSGSLRDSSRTVSAPKLTGPAQPLALDQPRAPAASRQPKAIAVAAMPATRASSLASIPHAPRAAAPPAALENPTGSSPTNVSVSNPPPDLRSARVAPSVAPARPQVPTCPVEQAASAEPKPVKVAMLPAIRGGEHDLSLSKGSAHSAIICPPPVRKDSKAKIEKRLIAAKGKIKLRDLINELGGVVFWDAETQTVTAYVRDIKLEVRIGSPVVKVNGRAMRTDLVAKLVNSRTIIDARLYDQVRAFLENKSALSRNP